MINDKKPSKIPGALQAENTGSVPQINKENIALNLAAGEHSVQIGDDSNSSGYSSIAIGLQANAAGAFGVGVGTYTKAIGHSSTALGVAASTYGDYSVAVGVGTSAANYSVALGAAANSSSDSSVSIGADSAAVGENSIAIGHNSITTEQQGKTFSVGNSDTKMYRRIINVADAIDDQDAVTKKQLAALVREELKKADLVTREDMRETFELLANDMISL